WLGTAQITTKDALGQEFFDVADALISGSLELLQREAGQTIGLIELLGTHARIPLRLKNRKLATDFFETHPIRALVRAGVVRKVNCTSRDHGSYDLGQVPYAVVVCGLAHVECFIEHVIRGRLECSNECSGNILNMYNWSPGHAVRFQVDLSGRECPGDQIVQDDIETQP